jgi:4-hydroxy-3-polyprenylbenzoate decarboxylase
MADGYCISTDADFVITGQVFPGENKPEGPFGDHLGYYSLVHDFPLMKVHKVYARKDAIWPFTVVGRPPQEDTSFGALIHEIAGSALREEIPGLKEVHAVDAAGVHPLLLAIGNERYTPYAQAQQPAELLTIANHILGTGQLSLAKFLFITADDSNKLKASDIEGFFRFFLERVDWRRDIHFQTNSTIDTLDYSGTSLNSGSKVVLAAYGSQLRELANSIPPCLQQLSAFRDPQIVLPGIIALSATGFRDYQESEDEFKLLDQQLAGNLEELKSMPLLVICDDARFVGTSLRNFLWVCFTRSNPSHDIYGIGSFQIHKHWGCNGPLLIDARIKPHHAPVLEVDPATSQAINRVFEKGGSLYRLG